MKYNKILKLKWEDTLIQELESSVKSLLKTRKDIDYSDATKIIATRSKVDKIISTTKSIIEDILINEVCLSIEVPIVEFRDFRLEVEKFLLDKFKNNTATLVIVTKDINLTKFMQCADIFESFKVLHEYTTEVVIKTTNKISIVVEDIKKNDTKGVVIALFLKETGEGWYDDTIRVLSFGKKWLLFKDYLKDIGYTK